MVSILIVWAGPVHQIQVHVVGSQALQRHVQILFNAAVKCTPNLARDEQVFTLYDAFLDRILDRFADFIFILIAECTIDVAGSISANVIASYSGRTILPIARLDSMIDSLLDLSFR